jgi:hypothetical protein
MVLAPQIDSIAQNNPFWHISTGKPVIKPCTMFYGHRGKTRRKCLTISKKF